MPVEGLVVTEGSLLAVAPSDLGNLMHRMTPSACLVARVFMLQNGKSAGTQA